MDSSVLSMECVTKCHTQNYILIKFKLGFQVKTYKNDSKLILLLQMTINDILIHSFFPLVNIVNKLEILHIFHSCSNLSYLQRLQHRSERLCLCFLDVSDKCQ